MNHIENTQIIARPIADETVDDMERTIRDLAGTVISYQHNRIAHPSYGYTKAMIREAAHRMEGAIGLYMVLCGQAAHAGVTLQAKFAAPATQERVDMARRAVALI